MGSPIGPVTSWIKVVYHLGKLAMALLFTLAVFKWKVWRAKTSFRSALLTAGLSEDVVKSLTISYAEGNKLISSLVNSACSPKGMQGSS